MPIKVMSDAQAAVELIATDFNKWREDLKLISREVMGIVRASDKPLAGAQILREFEKSTVSLTRELPRPLFFI